MRWHPRNLMGQEYILDQQSGQSRKIDQMTFCLNQFELITNQIGEDENDNFNR